jgi:SAM-dependent methyltransferase
MDADLFVTHAKMEDAHWWFLGRRRILRTLFGACGLPRSGSRLLDVGCGTGANSAAFSDGFAVVGVEPSEPAVTLARKRFPQITFVGGLAPDDVMEEAARTDVFLLTDVLEHVEHDRAMVEKLVRVAKPGAMFFITVPANMDLWTEHDVSHGHYRRYTLETFRNLWSNLPVETKLLSYYNSRLYPLVYTARRITQLRNKPASHNDTDLHLPPEPVNRVLQSVFAGEATNLVRHLGRGTSAYRKGVSVIGIFEKKAGGDNA